MDLGIKKVSQKKCEIARDAISQIVVCLLLGETMFLIIFL